jgi:hypothetical protein
VETVVDKVWKMNTERLRATAYYRKTIKALPVRPEKDEYSGWGNKLNVTFQGGAKAWFWVDAYDHYLLGIEGSGLLDLSVVTGKPGLSIPLSISSKNQWKVYPFAQWGLGNRLNPLVPGRDLANSQWPFGTRMIWGPPEKWVGTFRYEMYCADVFGDPLKPADRVDLFAGEEINFGNPDIRGEVTTPWTGVSKSPIKGFQECANILKIPGANGKPLDTDNIWGDNTNFALGAFLGKYREHFKWGAPKYRMPNDPEIYFQVRKVTQLHGN